MKVLSLTKSTGGLARYNEELALRLAEVDDIEIEVVCLSEERETYARRLQAAGLRAYPVDMPRYTIRPGGDARTALAVQRLLRRGGYDVVIGHGTKAGFLARVCGRLAGIPSVYRLASLAFVARTQAWNAWPYRQLEKLAGRFGGIVVTVSDATRNAAVVHRIAPAERIVTIRTGIDCRRWQDLPEARAVRTASGLEATRFTVGWAARMNQQKDPDAFLDAVAHLAGTGPDIQFCMAGEGPLRARIEQRVNSARLPVTLLPWQRDMSRFLAAVDVFVLTSRWEGLPLALLEAMAAGRVVVATPVDGVPEVVRHGVDGLLATRAVEIAAHLRRFAAEPAACGAFGRAARQRVEADFTVDEMVRKWVTTLRQATEGNRTTKATAMSSR